ncbi:DUF1566 domain-containing protein, partial [Psychrosphaera sp.]|nr:DUF1566 domain-containing protein [Psychrosphaera sp.]
MKSLMFIFILFFAVTISGCSGSESSDPSGNNLASVNLGTDITVLEGQTFALTASIYPEEGAVIWSQTQGPTIEEFPEDSALEVSLVAPSINVDSLIVIKVTYTTVDGQRVEDQINITVTNVNEEPIARITNNTDAVAPYETFEVITLTAEDSSDPDGEIRYYQWTQVDDNESLQLLSPATLSEITFQAPYVTEITNYKFELEVTDNFGLTATNTIDVQVAAAEGTVATAGQDQIVDEFTKVTLDASDSVSVDNVLSCEWEQLTGLSVTISSADQCIAEFFAPNVDSTELLTFQVTVIDNASNSESDTVNITVNPLNLGSLHDSGVIECYGATDVVPCDNVNYPNQDADTGRDSVRDAIDKSGSGDKTFDFTKFDINGDELPQDALVFSCVRDNFTGLVWEVKVDNASPKFSELHGVENYYSIDDTLPGQTSCSHPTSCGSETFVEEVNDETFCGGANWRIPTYLELMQILDYGELDQANLFPSDFFPNTPDAATLNHLFYWVSEVNIEGD